MRVPPPAARSASRAIAALCLSLVALALPRSARAGESHQTDGSLPRAAFVFFNPAASAVPPSDIAEALEALARLVHRRGIADLYPRIFKHVEDLERELDRLHRTGTMPWFGSLSVPYLLTRGYAWGYRPVTCALVDGQPLYRDLVVARRDAPIQTLADAPGHRLALTDVGSDTLSYMGATVFGGALDPREAFSEILPVDSAASAVMAVLYRQADLAIVVKAMFERLTTGAPALWRHLRVIHRSPLQTLSGHVAHMSVPPEVVEAFVELMTNDLAGRPEGAALIDLFRIDGFRRCSWDDYDERDGRLLEAAGRRLVRGDERRQAVARGAPTARYDSR